MTENPTRRVRVYGTPPSVVPLLDLVAEGAMSLCHSDGDLTVDVPGERALVFARGTWSRCDREVVPAVPDSPAALADGEVDERLSLAWREIAALLMVFGRNTPGRPGWVEVRIPVGVRAQADAIESPGSHLYGRSEPDGSFVVELHVGAL